MRIILLALCLIVGYTEANAGGTSVPVKMLELTQTGTDEYYLKLQTLDGDEYEFEELPKNTELTIYLYFAKFRYISKSNLLSIVAYRDAIELLKKVIKENKTARFGRVGRGICEITGKTNHFESDALKIIEEENYKSKQKKNVVYSFCRYE